MSFLTKQARPPTSSLGLVTFIAQKGVVKFSFA